MSLKIVYEWSLDGGKTFRKGFVTDCARETGMNVKSVQAKSRGQSSNTEFFIRKTGETVKPNNSQNIIAKNEERKRMKQEKADARQMIIAKVIARFHIDCEKEDIDIGDTMTYVAKVLQENCASRELSCKNCPLESRQYIHGTTCMIRQFAWEFAKNIPKDISMNTIREIDGCTR